MKSYFIYENNRQVGPFTREELATRTITAETPVWTQGMSEWTTAGKVDDLNSTLVFSPPPFNATSVTNVQETYNTNFASATERTGFKIGKLLKWPGKLVLVLLITFLVVSLINRGYSEPNYASSNLPVVEKSPEQLRAELLMLERNNPTDYIKGIFRNWENLMGERVIEVDFVNRATMANFKDIEILITFLSETQSEIGSKKYNVYKYLPAGQLIKHRLKVYGPSGTKNANVTVVSATAY